ncbi:MAG: hypothetical protein ACKVOR_12915 [Flavobacteriales bacterium]
MVIITAVVVVRCSAGKSTGAGMQGVIVYDVTFPFEANSVMLDLYPKQMTMHFKDHMMRSSIHSSYDLLTTDFIIDNSKHSVVQMLKNMGDRVVMELQDEQVNDWMKQYPLVRLEPTNETVTIAGYVCNKTMAYFQHDSLPPIELYHTKGLGIEPSNWWNQFNGVDGFLMGYDIQQYGKRMRLRAREVRFAEVSSDEFVCPANFKPVDQNEMNRQLVAVVEEFMQ